MEMSAEPISGPPVHRESTPPWLIVRYEFPATPDARQRFAGQTLPLTWYHGGKRPEIVNDELFSKFKSGVLFVGEKGMLVSDYGKEESASARNCYGKSFAGHLPGRQRRCFPSDARRNFS